MADCSRSCLGLKEPKFIAAYGGAELDPALMRGEIDARATTTDAILQTKPGVDRQRLGRLSRYHRGSERGQGFTIRPIFRSWRAFPTPKKERKILGSTVRSKDPGSRLCSLPAHRENS